MSGFFPESALTEQSVRLPVVARCGACGLYKLCRTPKMEPFGKGRILIVGQSPGADEDYQGRPFVGKSGGYLREKAQKAGLDLSRCVLTNALICRPPNNKTPPKAIDHCRPNLVNTIQSLNPEVIITLGAEALESLLGWVYRAESKPPIYKWAGMQIPCQQLNAWICPTYHPAHILRTDTYGKGVDEVLERLFVQHLKAVTKLAGRPWKKVPDYARRVDVILNPNEAADKIWAIGEAAVGPITIDYETDRLKPDHPEARIVSCALSNGENTIAFPWHGKARRELGCLLKSRVPMIAQNMKFEERWTRKAFGHGVKKWDFDTMLASHWLDNRPGVTGIEFQAFALLGQAPWDASVGPYLKSKGGGNTSNRIREVNLEDLLLYNGLDAILEWEVAMIQKRRGGLK